MPTQTYIALNTITLQSTASEVIFSNIPATYRDLIIVGSWAGSNAANYLTLQLNGDTGSNYPGVFIYGASNGTGSYTTNDPGLLVAITRTSIGPQITQILDANATDKHKAILSRYGLSDQSEVGMLSGRWASTAIVNSIRMYLNGGTISAGSTFSLYGVIA